MNTPLSIKETSASQGHRAASLSLSFRGIRLWVRAVWCTKGTSSSGKNTAPGMRPKKVSGRDATPSQEHASVA